MDKVCECQHISAAGHVLTLLQDVLKWAFVYVADPIQTPLLLSMLLELILGAFAAPLVGQCFFKSLVSRTAELAREVHDFLVSPACITSDVKRARAISRLIVAISTGLQNHPPFNVVADPLRLHVLIRRLSDGPTEAWATADKVLLSAFSTPFASPISRADVRSILLLLREEQWQDAGEDLRVSPFGVLSRLLIDATLCSSCPAHLFRLLFRTWTPRLCKKSDSSRRAKRMTLVSRSCCKPSISRKLGPSADLHRNQRIKKHKLHSVSGKTSRTSYCPSSNPSDSTGWTTRRPWTTTHSSSAR